MCFGLSLAGRRSRVVSSTGAGQSQSNFSTRAWLVELTAELFLAAAPLATWR